MSWTDERIATLKKMWLQGKSASEIAEKLGGVTRNAVIGKAHRLNLSGRPSPIKKPGAEKKPVAKAQAAEPVQEAAPVRKPAPEPALAKKTAPAAAPKPVPVAPKAPEAPAPKAAAPPVPASTPSKAQPQRSSGNGPGKPPEIVQLAALANATSRPDGAIVSILELNERTCRWPVGDPRDAGFGYCGAESYMAHPYCAEHVAIAFQAPNRKDRKPVKNVKEAEAPELDDLEIEVEVEDEDAIDDETLEDDLDDDTPVTI
ncbi:MAG: GcrA cell cycle regulator [Alphaproteobacteria bacterium]|nr:GcrA cell cycle regulator [Alphaproteobacteria bacterium]